MSAIPIILAHALTAAAAVTVYRAEASSGVLEVYDDDTYALWARNGSASTPVPWLVSGPTAIHVGGQWYAAAAPPGAAEAAVCTSMADTDCRNTDLYFFNASSPSDCCANCSATPSCGAWTYTGTTMKGHDDGVAPPPWAYRCYIKSGCDHQTYAGHTSGLPASAVPLPLTRLGAGPGAAAGWEVRYQAANVSLTVSFDLDVARDAFIFRQRFPLGAHGVAILTPSNATTRAGGVGRLGTAASEFASSSTPATQFPVFSAAGGAAAAAMGYITWRGRFFGAVSAGTGGAGAGLDAAGGAEGGPLVLFDATDGAQAAAVIAPWDNFKSTMLGRPQSGAAGSAAAGVSGYVASLPANFSTSTAVVFGAAGITDTVHKWGAALLDRSGGGAKLDDPSSTQLSYWTDNGAYYDFYAYEPNITSKGVPQDILEALADTFRNGSYPGPPLPVRMLMLDAYWMYNTRSNGNCKMNDSYWPTPFPRGLRSLADATAWPLIIYNGPQCADSSYAGAWPLVYSLYWDQGWGAGVLSAVDGASSEAFYTATFRALAAQGMATFTQDFLDFQGLLFPDWLAAHDGNAPWMRGAARAALAQSVPTQYCMALPSDLLQSTEFAAVTNARASDDYGVGGDNWRIGSSSLLLSALGVRASKDNFATGAATDRGRESSPFLVAAVAALSHGPVGISDAILRTNPAVVWPTTTRNGTLLHASRPATVLDAQLRGAGPLAAGDIRAAHSVIDGGGFGPRVLFYSVLAARAAPHAVPDHLTAGELWPQPTTPAPNGSNWLLWQFNNSACATDGGDAAACVSVLGASPAPAGTRALRPAAASGDAIAWELWTAVPLLQPSGANLLGELGKFVAVSPDRFRRVEPSAAGDGGLLVTLAGAPFEPVALAWLQHSGSGPGQLGTVRTATLTLGADGTLTQLLL